MRRAVVALGVTAIVVLSSCSGSHTTQVTSPVTSPSPAGCLDPRAPHARPATGWLADDAGAGGELAPGTNVVRSSAGLDALVGVVEHALPEGFTVSSRRESTAGACAVRREVRAQRADRAFVYVALEQLGGTRSLFSIPLGAQAQTEVGGDGSEVLTDDFDGRGTRRTELFVTADGLFVEVIAAGAGAPDLSGWPTTTASPPGQRAEPGPAPLSSAALDSLAHAAAALAH